MTLNERGRPRDRRVFLVGVQAGSHPHDTRSGMTTKKAQRAGTGTSESTRGRHVSFEVLHSGSRVARAAIPGFAVLGAHATWVRRELSRYVPDSKVEREEFLFSLGGLDSSDPTTDRFLNWTTPPLGVAGGSSGKKSGRTTSTA
jgi:hypothetical protein